MTFHDRPRTDPIAGHAYTLPVVREIPVPGSLSASFDPAGSRRSMLTPVAVAQRTVRRVKPSDGQPSQRDLVALSLLLRPDGRDPGDPGDPRDPR